MAGKVTIGCKLPNGFILHHPLKPREAKDATVVLNGLNKVTIIGATYATTEVDADFWTAWKSAYKDFEPLKMGAIFEGNPKEVERVRTGLEPMTEGDPRMRGEKVVKADK